MKPVKTVKKTHLVLRRETVIVLTSTPLTKARGGGVTPSDVEHDEPDDPLGRIAGVCVMR